MINVRMSKGVAVLTFDTPNGQVAPSISLSETSVHLKTLLEEIDQQYNRTHRQIVINVTDVIEIGNEAIIGLTSKSSKPGIRICLYDRRRVVRNIFREVANEFSRIFDIYPSEEAAIESFR